MLWVFFFCYKLLELVFMLKEWFYVLKVDRLLKEVFRKEVGDRE